MNDRITLTEIEAIAKTSLWERGNIKRYYINIPGFADKMWWEEDGKIRYQDGKGRSSEEAITVAEHLIGCNLVDRRSKASPYVIVK